MVLIVIIIIFIIIRINLLTNVITMLMIPMQQAFQLPCSELVWKPDPTRKTGEGLA